MSLLSVMPKGDIRSTEIDLIRLAANYGYEFKESEIADFATILAATAEVIQSVDEMEDYQPEPDLSLTPRTNIYFPDKKENPDNAWAWRFHLEHKSPATELLKGKTVCVKDNVCIAGVPCLLGTDIFTDWIPQTDATIVSRILDSSGVIIGKAVCENLSTTAVSHSAATGRIDNPYVPGYSCGGSSSGTANLVALKKADLGIGADQGGSIRIPAALCGLYGMKATAGLVPYTGCVSYEAIFDSVGPMTRTCMDNALLLEAIVGLDGLDDRQGPGVPSRDHAPQYSKILLDTKDQGIKGLRIGIMKESLSMEGVDKGVEAKFRAAAKVFQELGANVEEVSIPMHEISGAIFTTVHKLGGALGRDGRATGRRQVMLTDLYDKLLPLTKESIEKMSVVSKNNHFSGEYCWEKFPNAYSKAVNLSRKLTLAYDAALSKYDVLIMPTTITPSRRMPHPGDSPLAQMANATGKMENTCQWNLTGHPALSMPIGFVDAMDDAMGKRVRLPTSLQIVGSYFQEALMYRIAFAWEGARKWEDF